MGFDDNLAAVRKDVSGHAMNIFVEYFIKFPKHQDVFNDYKGKEPESLKSIPKFKNHVTNVVTMLLSILETASKGGALTDQCQKVADMPQHKSLNIQQFKDVGVVLVPYLQKTLGEACDTSGWTAAYNNFTTTLAVML